MTVQNFCSSALEPFRCRAAGETQSLSEVTSPFTFPKKSQHAADIVSKSEIFTIIGEVLLFAAPYSSGRIQNSLQ